MINTRPIALVEADDRRRARISHAGAADGLHLEPFETAAELQVLADTCAILVHDEGSTLCDTLDNCARSGQWRPVIAYSSAPTAIRVADAMFSGALDYLAWPFEPGELRECLERIGERAEIVGKRRASAVTASSKLKVLSGRERAVVAGMVDGFTNKEIARRLQISPRTVEIHRSNAIGKLGARTSSEVIILAISAADAPA